MTATRRNNYADRAHAFRTSAATARQAGNHERATTLEALADRCQSAHQQQPWRTADDLRYGTDDCCNECEQHVSDSHRPDCIYVDVSHAVA